MYRKKNTATSEAQLIEKLVEMSAGNQFTLCCCSDLMPLPHSQIKEVGVYKPFSQNTSLAQRMG